MLDENTKYQLSVEASNHFGASRSDPFILCVKDVGKDLLLFQITHKKKNNIVDWT